MQHHYFIKLEHIPQKLNISLRIYCLRIWKLHQNFYQKSFDILTIRGYKL